MDLAIKITYQVAIMFLFIVTGFILSKCNKISDKGRSDITTLLLAIVTPCVLISSYQKKVAEYSFDLLSGLALAAAFTVVIHIIAILICSLVFKNRQIEKNKVNLFASVYSNCGFMAIPILSSVLGPNGVFYGSIYLAIFTFFYWTHGIVVYTGSMKAISLKKLILNPGVVGTLLALLLFLFKIELPEIVNSAVDSMADLNTPLSMIVLGTYLAGVNWKTAFSRASLYLVCFLRLILIPLIAMGIIILCNSFLETDTLILRSVLIPSACPVATATALFASRYNSDASYASELVAISTLFSIVTLPVIMVISAYFIG